MGGLVRRSKAVQDGPSARGADFGLLAGVQLGSVLVGGFTETVPDSGWSSCVELNKLPMADGYCGVRGGE